MNSCFENLFEKFKSSINRKLRSDRYKNESHHIACLNRECDKISSIWMNSCQEIFVENLEKEKPKSSFIYQQEDDVLMVA